MLTRDLGLRLDLSTVNCWFEAEGFIKYIEKLDYWANYAKIVSLFLSGYSL